MKDKDNNLESRGLPASRVGTNTTTFSHKAFYKELTNFIEKPRTMQFKLLGPADITPVCGAEILQIFLKIGSYPGGSKK